MTLKQTLEKLEELRKAKAGFLAEARKLMEGAEKEKRSLSDDETKAFDKHIADGEALDKEIEPLEVQEKRLRKLVEQETSLKATQGRSVPALNIENRATPANHAETRERAIAETRLSGSLKNFTNDADGKWKAYRFGMWCLAVMGRRSRHQAQTFCRDHGLYHFSEDISYDEARYMTPETRAAIGQVENVNTAGGYLVPDEFNNDIIVLREKFGVFRPNAKRIPMTRDTSARPRRTGGLTASFVGEGAAGTASTKAWDLVSLQAKKLMCLALYSSELNEDAVINVGDDLAGEIAYAFANKEDLCGFTGDGTSSFGGIIGVQQALLKLTGTPPGIITQTGNGWSAIVIGDFNKVVGALPQFADTPNAAWYCHKTFWGQVMQKLLTAFSGNRISDGQAGALSPWFLGYPVRITQTMNSTTAAGQIPVFLGDLSLAADFGDRRETTIAFSNSATIGSTNAFAQDALAIRGTERFDINVHDVGSPTVTGPIVGLKTA